MKIKNLVLFKRMHSNGVPINMFLIAGWHWKNSITWRWALTYENFKFRFKTQENIWKK